LSTRERGEPTVILLCEPWSSQRHGRRARYRAGNRDGEV